MMNELTIYRTLHCLLAVARVVSELRAAVTLIQAATGEPETPYKVDGLDASALDALAELANLVQTLERNSVELHRSRKRRMQRGAHKLERETDVSRETSPDTERAAPPADEGFPF